MILASVLRTVRFTRAIGILLAGAATASMVTSAPAAQAATPGLIWPASGSVSQNVAEHLATEGARAVDIASWATNNPVVAAAAGTIVTASSGGNTQCHSVDPASNGLGNYVTVRHSSVTGTTYTTYAHLATLSVTMGQSVSQGDALGIMGNTGCSTGPHVHFVVSTCQAIFTCTLWNDPDPANGTAIAKGTSITNSSYPGTDQPSNSTGGIRDVTVAGGSTIVVSPTGQNLAPKARFVVDLPDGAKAPYGTNVLSFLSFRLIHPTSDSSYASLDWNGYCGDPFTCEVSGQTVIVTLDLTLGDADLSAALDYPGAYDPLVAVETYSESRGPITLYADPTSPVEIVKRATRVANFNASPEPVMKGAPVTVSGVLERARACPKFTTISACSGGKIGYWAAYGSRTIHIYFDPSGTAGPEYMGSATTSSSGRFSRAFTATESGSWFARYAGNSVHQRCRSVLDYVATG